MLLISYYLSILGIFVCGYFAIRQATQKSKGVDVERKDFPGPYLLPWIGRIHDLPIQYMWIKFKEWVSSNFPSSESLHPGHY